VKAEEPGTVPFCAGDQPRNNKESKLAFFRYISDELKRELSVRPDDVMVNLVFVDRADWSFGRGEPCD
jgi:hypothetical protein